MDCPACHASLDPGSAFCSRCGRATRPIASGVPARDGSISDGATPAGVWYWLLLLLLSGERLLAVFAFQVDESRWLAAGWERPFLWLWGLALGLPAMGLLALRRRMGGWLAALSGFALAARACVPVLSESRSAEEQVYGAVFSLMVASATLTFAFLYDQSFWGKPGSPLEQDESG